MSTIDDLKRNIKLLMFDQYGTVVDMQAGLIEVATPFLQKKGWTGRPDAFVTWWRRTHFENSMIDALLQREHITYRRIGEISWQVTQQYVPQALLLSDAAIREAQLWLWREMRLAVEPAAALGLAALQSGAYRPAQADRVCLVICGANVDPGTLAA